MTSISVEHNERLKETLSNIKQIREELNALGTSEKVEKTIFEKLDEIHKMAVDASIDSMEQKEGVSEELERIRNLSDDLRITAWKKVAIDKQTEVKAELFSFWYSDKDLEKEFRSTQEIMENAGKTKNVEDIVRDYKTAIDKLLAIAEDLSKMKQRSSLKNMGKFLVWAVPFVFTLAQFLAQNQIVILGYVFPWYLPLAGLFVGSCAVWGWIRSKRKTKEDLGFVFATLLVIILSFIAFLYLVGLLMTALGFQWDITTGMVTIIAVYALAAIITFGSSNRKGWRKAVSTVRSRSES